MEELKRRILAQAENLGHGILKVDGFISHQIDTHLMLRIGKAIASRFEDAGLTKVVTAEISGIAPALATGYALDIPVIYARKVRTATMTGPVYVEASSTPVARNSGDAFLMISAEYLGPDDRALIVDDFLASGSTIEALVRLVNHAGATLVGIGTIIEKQFEGGREELSRYNVPIVSLAVITDMSDGKIVVE